MKTKLLFVALVALVAGGARAADYLTFGGKGASGLMKSKVTVYASAQDGQPKCPGCKVFRVVYDDLNGAVGATWVTDFRVRFSEECENAFSGDERTFKLTRLPGTQSMKAPAVGTGQILLSTMSELHSCEDSSLTLEFLRRKCMNPMAPECREMVVSEEAKFRLGDILRLQLVHDEDKIPNWN
ncbi:MAG: hypothetical protein JST16_04425 [Bdellovibrionales bacterium]|nr:hypothetical protein [Bdellovibrionales bacterium]